MNNICSVSFPDMLAAVSAFSLERVPEGNTPQDLTLIDQQLARFANQYAYLIHLFAQVAYEVVRLKRLDPEAAEAMIKKKDALYEIAKAVKLKWQACSRRLTKSMGDDEEELPYEHRNYQQAEQKLTPLPWAPRTVDTRARRTPRGAVDTRVKTNGGWENVP